mmetsp:Transcript_112985/g.319595  ORF Transcript_112985/g.319595 Transcript_112985/m.319595 type:complete len:231 (+) Transcript_112985:794-1486(+)
MSWTVLKTKPTVIPKAKAPATENIMQNIADFKVVDMSSLNSSKRSTASSPASRGRLRRKGARPLRPSCETLLCCRDAMMAWLPPCGPASSYAAARLWLRSVTTPWEGAKVSPLGDVSAATLPSASKATLDNATSRASLATRSNTSSSLVGPLEVAAATRWVAAATRWAAAPPTVAPCWTPMAPRAWRATKHQAAIAAASMPRRRMVRASAPQLGANRIVRIGCDVRYRGT